jgi:hypothetical protein
LRNEYLPLLLLEILNDYDDYDDDNDDNDDDDDNNNNSVPAKTVRHDSVCHGLDFHQIWKLDNKISKWQ